jgi:hypothetical protein
VPEARAEKLRLQSLELGGAGPSDREAKLREKIDRLRSEEQKLADRYGLDDNDDKESLSAAAPQPARRFVKRG